MCNIDLKLARYDHLREFVVTHVILAPAWGTQGLFLGACHRFRLIRLIRLIGLRVPGASKNVAKTIQNRFLAGKTKHVFGQTIDKSFKNK